MGTHVIIAGLKGELLHTVKGLSNEALKSKNEFIVKLLMALDDHAAFENGISANLSLSQQGQMEAGKKFGTNETAPALKWMKNVIKEKQEKNQRYEQQFFTITSGIENAGERIPIFIYLWGKLDVLDQSARIKQFLQASEQDDLKVMAAMLEHVLGPMINEDVKQRGLTDRAKRLFPRDYENYEQNQILLEFLTMARDWLARWLNQEVGVEIPVIRTNFGDEIADALTGLPQLAGV